MVSSHLISAFVDNIIDERRRGHHVLDMQKVLDAIPSERIPPEQRDNVRAELARLRDELGALAR